VRDVGVISVGCSSLDGFGTAARAFGIPILGGFEKNLARKLLHERIHSVKLGHDAKFIPGYLGYRFCEGSRRTLLASYCMNAYTQSSLDTMQNSFLQTICGSI